MDKFIRTTAFIINGLVLLCLLLMLPQLRPNETFEYLTVAALFIAPVINLAALWQGPDLEERRLRRQLAKAEMRQRLKELGA